MKMKNIKAVLVVVFLLSAVLVFVIFFIAKPLLVYDEEAYYYGQRNIQLYGMQGRTLSCHGAEDGEVLSYCMLGWEISEDDLKDVVSFLKELDRR